MLSMLKEKKGFAVFFNDVDAEEPSGRGTEVVLRPSSTLFQSGSERPSEGEGAPYQCQRCSKGFSLPEEGEGNGASIAARTECHRCGYPTCHQCREPAAGSPGWVCCVCSGPKSLMWLLERTRAGPMLVSNVLAYCDPRGQRLMRLMFRFTLQQFQAPIPPAVLSFGKRVRYDSNKGGAFSTGPRQTSPTAPVATSAVANTSGTSLRVLEERGGGGLRQVSPSNGNIRSTVSSLRAKPVPYLRATGEAELDSKRAEGNSAAPTEAVCSGGIDGTPAPQPRGSEALRRTEEAPRVVAYSPESQRRAQEHDPDEVRTVLNAEPDEDGASPLEKGCPTAANICGVTDATAPPAVVASETLLEVSEVTPIRTSAKARGAFQREAFPLQLTSGTVAALRPVECCGPVAGVAGMSPIGTGPVVGAEPDERLGCFGGSLSPASSGSGRSASPAPRFPSFVEFLVDQAAVTSGQTFLPRHSDVLLTVSPDTGSDDDGDSGNRGTERGGQREVRSTAAGTKKKSSVRASRGAQPRTPLADGGGSSALRSSRCASGLEDITPTRMLELTSARGTHRRGSNGSQVCTARSSLVELHAPQLYGCRGSSKADSARRSGQPQRTSLLYELPTPFSSRPKNGLLSARGQQRHPSGAILTRTAGRMLGNDGRQRLAPQRSYLSTPLQRTPSTHGGFQRTASRTAVPARTHSSTAPLTRTDTSPAADRAFARTNSAAVHLHDRRPSCPTQRLGIATCRERPPERTAATRLTRTASAHNPHVSTAAATHQMERTHSRHAVWSGAASAHASLVKRAPTPVSTSLLTRTASVTRGARGAMPFGAATSTMGFNRSATAATGFTRTASAAAPGLRTPARRPLNVFTRTATGTRLRSCTQNYVADAGHRVAPLVPTYTGATQPRGWYRSGADSARGVARGSAPLRRTPSAPGRFASPLGRPAAPSAYGRPVMGRRDASSLTLFHQSGTGMRGFERQPSHHQLASGPMAPAAVTQRTVDPAPALAATARRSVTGTALRRTPSRAGTGSTSSLFTSRTPRQYVISSVSTAATPAATTGSGLHSGARPVLCTGTGTPMRPHQRDSVRGVDAVRASGGPENAAPAAQEVTGRSSALHSCPVAAATATGSSEGVTRRVATPLRSPATARRGTNTTAAQARTRSAAPSTTYPRRDSRR